MPHNAYRKRREVAVIGLEATPGATPTKQHTMHWLDKNFRSIPNILENESAMGEDARVNDSAIDVWHSEGSLGGKVTENGIAVLLNGVLNKVTTTALTGPDAGKYKHVFTRDKTVARKTFSFWDVRPPSIRLFKSLYMDNLAINLEVGESGAWLQFTSAFKGWKHTDTTGVTPAFDATEDEFTSRHVKLFLADDVAGLADTAASRLKVKSFTITLEETATPDHAIGETDNDPEFDSAPAEVRGTFVVKYRKTDLEEDFFTNAVHAMKLLAENNGDIIEILATKVRFRELTDSDGRDDIVTQTVSFYCEADVANAMKDVEVSVTNRLASFTV